MTNLGEYAFANSDNLTEIWFEGDLPEMAYTTDDDGVTACYVFKGVTATAYYPSTWTTVPSSTEYGGNLTWVPYDVTTPVDEVFSDVSATAWYYDAVQFVYDNGIMSGVGGGKFNPTGTTTRAMVVQMLYSLAGSPTVSGTMPFTDVSSDAWYYNAVLWAYQNDVASGTSTTKFSPTTSVTREQFAQLLYNYEDTPSVSGTLTGFEDTDEISSWAQNAILWANQEGIVNGKLDGDKYYIDPQGLATRAEAAALMTNYMS